jgi:hypothetical protein
MDGTVSLPNPSATMTCPHPATAQFTLDSTALSQATGLYLKTHGLNYSTQGSFQINSSPWVRMKNTNTSATINQDNPTVTFFGNIASFGGIGGAYTIVRMEIPLSTPTIGSAATLGKYLQVGTNTISFCFNGTDSRSSGYRVVDMNLYNNSAAPVTLGSGAQAIVTYENNTGWTTYPSDGNAANGQTLFTQQTLVESSVSTNVNLLAHCNDCHTNSGNDLRYFNYSNFAIRQRAIFHGITNDQDLDDLVTYIRTMNVADATSPSTAGPGRPWWPPFQPGPGLDAAPASHWSAGAGDTAILDSDQEALQYFPNSGLNASSFLDSETGHLLPLNLREMPVAFPLLDWNHWLPAVHPVDALGSVATFEATAAYKDYQTILTNLTNYASDAGKLAYYTAGQFTNDMTNWYLDRGTLEGNVGAAIWPTNQQKGFSASYDAALWSAVKDWDLHLTYGLVGIESQMIGTHAQPREWNDSERFIFDVSPHLSGYFDYATSTIGGNPIYVPIFGDVAYWTSLESANLYDQRLILQGAYLADVWYETQMILFHGDNSYLFGGHNVIDWGYMNGQQGLLFAGIGQPTESVAGNTIQPMVAAKFALTSLYEHDTGVGPLINDFAYTVDPYNHTATFDIGMGSVGNNPGTNYAPMNNNWNLNPQYANLIESYYQIWLQKIGAFNIDAWPTWTESFNSDGQVASMFNLAMTTGSVEPNISGELALLQSTYHPCTTGACANLPIAGALLNDYVRWADTVWPGPSGTPNNWEQYALPNSTVSAPTNVTASSGVGTITLDWNAVSGATSYNIKRTTDSTKAPMTISFFVTGTTFTDDRVQGGVNYYYTVSANVDVSGVASHFGSKESADSEIVTAVPGTGLVASWVFDSYDSAPGTLIPNSVTAHPMTGTPVQIIEDASSLHAPYFMSVDDNLARWLAYSSTVVAYVTVQPAAIPQIENFFVNGIMGSRGLYYGAMQPGTGKIGMMYDTGCSSTSNIPMWSTNTIADGKKHLVAMSYNATTGVMEMSIDGAAPIVSTGCVGDFSGDRLYNIGQIDGDFETFPGEISGVSIYNTAYQGAELQALQ